MKKIFLLVAFIATALTQKTFAQDGTTSQTPSLLSIYYDIKNALVSGNAAAASSKAEEFVTTLNGTDFKAVDGSVREALLKDAGHISKTKDIKHQREHFAVFSTNMYALVKAVKLTSEPIYYDYCPMQKAYWLSSEAAVKNPYYGSAMLTCGKVQETLK
ncbi:MAG: DUF3347 domain-containing protein [Bacteroidota bacterium]|nr:DUF3347 domain-containing protein [Bacteroidota bacterium]